MLFNLLLHTVTILLLRITKTTLNLLFVGFECVHIETGTNQKPFELEKKK